MPMTKRPPRTAHLRVRLTDAVRDGLDRLAAERGESVSELVRGAVADLVLSAGAAEPAPARPPDPAPNGIQPAAPTT